MNDFNTLPLTRITMIADKINAITASIRIAERADARAMMIQFYDDLATCDKPLKLLKRLHVWTQLYPAAARSGVGPS